MRRRDAIKRLGALAGMAAAPRLLSGCGDNERPEPGITNIVVVCMENRSYDHWLGARSLVEGLPGDGLLATMSNREPDGTVVPVYPEPTPCVPDPPHSWSSGHAQWNNGANDGFLTTYRAKGSAGGPPYVMGYQSRTELPFSWALADAYTSCDRWFCSLLGPTWPNRMYLHSAQSGGLSSNDLPGAGGFNWRSIWHSLNDGGVDWAYYYSDLPFVPLFDNLDYDGRVRRVNYDFFDDAAAGALPPVVFVDPNSSLNDDHPPHHPMLGQQFLAAIYAALADGPQWNNLLFVITYDEHGGFFDHVSPPTAADVRAADGFGQLGFRVPTIVAGPYVKQGHVSSVVRDHSSVLAHIAGMFDLPPLTDRDAAATDLTELLDLERLAAGRPRAPAPMPAIEIDSSMVDAACFSSTDIVHDIQVLAERGYFRAEHDPRGEVRDYAWTLGHVLDRHNAGRIRQR